MHRHLYQGHYALKTVERLMVDQEARPAALVFDKLKLPDDSLIFHGEAFRHVPESSIANLHQLRLRLRNINITADYLSKYAASARYDMDTMRKHIAVLGSYMPFVADEKLAPCCVLLGGVAPKDDTVVAKQDKTSDIVMESYAPSR